MIPKYMPLPYKRTALSIRRAYVVQRGYFLTFIAQSPVFRRFKSAGPASDKVEQYQSLGPCQGYAGYIFNIYADAEEKM